MTPENRNAFRAAVEQAMEPDLHSAPGSAAAASVDVPEISVAKRELFKTGL